MNPTAYSLWVLAACSGYIIGESLYAAVWGLALASGFTLYAQVRHT